MIDFYEEAWRWMEEPLDLPECLSTLKPMPKNALKGSR